MRGERVKKKEMEGQFAELLDRLQRLEEENQQLRQSVSELNERVDRESAVSVVKEQETVTLLTNMEEQGKWREIVQLLELQASKCAGKRYKCEILLRQALVLAENLNEPEKAVPVLKQAALCDPSNPAVFEALYDLHKHTGQWASLIQLLREIAAFPGNIPNPRALLLCARVLDQHLEEPEEAQVFCKKVLEVDPDNEDARQLLDSLILR
jgi:tetratricopeptide (TPR) repeat protein